MHTLSGGAEVTPRSRAIKLNYSMSTYSKVILMGADGAAAVFIDIIGRPLTPMSYAGVARRTAYRGACTQGAATVGAAALAYGAYARPACTMPSAVLLTGDGLPLDKLHERVTRRTTSRALFFGEFTRKLGNVRYGTKQTFVFAPHMSAIGVKRTSKCTAATFAADVCALKKPSEHRADWVLATENEWDFGR